MFGGYLSGEDSSPEPDCLHHCKDGVDVDCSNPTSHQEPEKIDFDYSNDSLSFPVKNLSLQTKLPPLSALRLKFDGLRNFHSPSNARDIFPQLFFELRESRTKHWMALDYHFLDAEAVECSQTLCKEHDFRKPFSTLPSMLLVAITATLVSAARQRDTEKIRHLQQKLEDRDRESRLLHDKIRQLQEHLSFWKENVIPFRRNPEIVEPIDQNLGLNESTPKCDSVILEQFATPQVWQQRIERNSKKTSGFRTYSRVDSVVTGELQVGHSGIANLNKTAFSVSGRPLFLERLSESPVQSAADQRSEKLTPQLPLQLNEISTPECPASGFSHNQKLLKQLIVDDIPAVMDALSLVKEKAQIFQSACAMNAQSASDMNAALELKQYINQALNEIISVKLLMHKIGNSVGLIDGLKVSASGDGLHDNLHTKAEVGDGSQVINEDLFCRGDRSYGTISADMCAIDQQGFLIEDSLAHQSDEHRLSKLVTEQQQEPSTASFDSSTLLDDTLEDGHKFDSDSLNEAFEDVHKTLTLCIEDCNTKEQKISSLKEEISVLHGIVSDLRTLQVNQVTGQADPSSLQTFVTSNVLFNLDSPVEVDSTDMPIEILSPWKELSQEFIIPTVFIEKEGVAHNFADIERSESSPELLMTENYRKKDRRAHSLKTRKSESSLELSTVADPRRKGKASNSYSETHSSCKTGHISDYSSKESSACGALRKSLSKQSVTTASRSSRGSNCNVDKVRWSSSSIEQLQMNSGNSSPEEDEMATGGYGEIQVNVESVRIGSPCPRKPRFSSATTNHSEKFDDGSHKPRRRNDKNHVKGNSVLSGVEPNTPMRPGGKAHKHLRSSFDSLNKSKENRSERRRWM